MRQLDWLASAPAALAFAGTMAEAASGDSGASGSRFNAVFQSLPTTVFEEMSILAAKHESTNLGQGFPDTELEGPESMKAIASRCANKPALGRRATTIAAARCCRRRLRLPPAARHQLLSWNHPLPPAAAPHTAVLHKCSA